MSKVRMMPPSLIKRIQLAINVRDSLLDQRYLPVRQQVLDVAGSVVNEHFVLAPSTALDAHSLANRAQDFEALVCNNDGCRESLARAKIRG